MDQKHQVIPAVFVVVQEDSQVLLHRRKGTGFRDGEYDVPSGHIEEGEIAPAAAIRELEEESGLKTTQEKLELFHIINNGFETPGKPYLYLFFRVNKDDCAGTFEIREPDKCDDMAMFPISRPPNVVPHVSLALKNIACKSVTFSSL